MAKHLFVSNIKTFVLKPDRKLMNADGEIVSTPADIITLDEDFRMGYRYSIMTDDNKIIERLRTDKKFGIEIKEFTPQDLKILDFKKQKQRELEEEARRYAEKIEKEAEKEGKGSNKE